MIFALFIFLFFVIVYLLKKQEREHLAIINNILDSFTENQEIENIPDEVKDKYKNFFNDLRKQKKELDISIDGLKEYKNELEITYNALIKKTTQLEYSNQALERRVANLSNINALARTVLSVMEIERTVDIILDAYFVLTGAKRISLYLWEKGNLKLKKIKGNIKCKNELSYEEDQLKFFTSDDYVRIYTNLSKEFNITEEETVIVSPLVVKGKELGVIFVVEDKEKLIDLDEETISALVIQISIAINNARIYSDLLVKERMSKELELASRMQKKIIPQDVKYIFGLEVANYFEPAKEIGGDYYDYVAHPNETFSVTMADVSGKGVPAAFLMALARSILRTLSTRGIEPKEELNALNQIIYQDITEDMFITIMHCKFDYKTKTLTYSNAGHNPILVYKSAIDEIVSYSVKGVAIGFVENYEYRQASLKLDRGDIVVLYTDGITEAENQKKELFGMERLKKVIYKNKNASAEEIKQSLLASLEDFKDNYEQVDDSTFVILKNNE